MLTSIIITTYNLESHIEESVRSAQRNSVDEIIIVDDGSTDATVAAVKALANQDPRICLIEQANGGSSSARNRGARAAKGKYILFLDGDDILSPHAIAELSDMLEASDGAACAYGQWSALSEDGASLPPNMKLTSRFSGFVLKDILKRGFLMPGCTLIRKRLFDAMGGFDQHILFAEDWEFFCRLSLEGDFLPTDSCVLGYRLRASSKSSSATVRRTEKVYHTVDHVFANPRLREHFSEQRLQLMRREARACAVLGISTRNFWERDYLASYRHALLAVRDYPPMLPRVIARCGLNLLLGCSFLFRRSLRHKIA